MVTVNIVGNLDKKVLVFPIANAFSVMGNTLIVTDDTSYEWYLTAKRRIGDVKVLIKRPEEINFKEDKEYDDGDEYQYMIFDTRDKANFEVNQTVICRNKNRELIPEEIREVTDEVEYQKAVTPSVEVVLTAFHNKIEEKKKGYLRRGNELPDKAQLIQLKPEHYKWLCECAETKEILSPKDKKLVDTVVALVADLTKVSAKSFAKATEENPVEHSEH